MFQDYIQNNKTSWPYSSTNIYSSVQKMTLHKRKGSPFFYRYQFKYVKMERQSYWNLSFSCIQRTELETVLKTRRAGIVSNLKEKKKNRKKQTHKCTNDIQLNIRASIHVGCKYSEVLGSYPLHIHYFNPHILNVHTFQFRPKLTELTFTHNII